MRTVRLVIAIAMLTGCVPSPSPSGSPLATATPAGSGASSSSSPNPTPDSSPGPSATTGPTPAPTAIALPNGLDQFAWASLTPHRASDGSTTSDRFAAGRLGATASITLEVDRVVGTVPWTATEGRYAVLVEGAHGLQEASANGRLRVFDAIAGSLLLDRAIPGLLFDHGVDSRPAAIDPDRGLVYVAAVAGLDVQISRITVATGEMASLLTIPGAEAPVAPFPEAWFSYGLDSAGALAVLECAARACRTWTVAADAAAASSVLGLPGLDPTRCSMSAVSERGIVVTAGDACRSDDGDADVPQVAIDRTIGAVTTIANEPQINIARVISIGGRALGIAAKRSNDWTTTSVVAFDITSGERTVIGDPFQNDDPHMVWLGLSPMRLPGPWVLLEPWGSPFEPGAAIPDARLVEVGGNRVIELPAGTFGWFG